VVVAVEDWMQHQYLSLVIDEQCLLKDSQEGRIWLEVYEEELICYCSKVMLGVDEIDAVEEEGEGEPRKTDVPIQH